MEILFSILFSVIPLLFLGGVIYFIVYIIKRKDGQPFNVTIKQLLHIYLYIISFITLAVAVFGGTLMIKSGLSYAFGIPFSYNLYETNNPETMVKENIDTESTQECYTGEAMTIDGVKVCFDENTRKQDLVNGSTFFVSMLILFVLHRLGIKSLEKEKLNKWLNKIYIFASLIVYSLVGVISIPLSIYQVLNFYLINSGKVVNIDAPGGSIALAIMVIPLWIYFLVTTLRIKEE